MSEIKRKHYILEEALPSMVDSNYDDDKFEELLDKLKL